MFCIKIEKVAMRVSPLQQIVHPASHRRHSLAISVRARAHLWSYRRPKITTHQLQTGQRTVRAGRVEAKASEAPT
jgi:hypothetical protein